MNKRKTLSMLGMCRKAGKLRQGFDAVKDSMRGGEAHLVLLADGLSERTVRQTTNTAHETGTPVISCAITMDEVCGMTGKKTGVMAIIDRGLAEAVKNAICLEEEMS